MLPLQAVSCTIASAFSKTYPESSFTFTSGSPEISDFRLNCACVAESRRYCFTSGQLYYLKHQSKLSSLRDSRQSIVQSMQSGAKTLGDCIPDPSPLQSCAK